MRRGSPLLTCATASLNVCFRPIADIRRLYFCGVSASASNPFYKIGGGLLRHGVIRRHAHAVISLL
jgi:hypothetical protein